MNKKINKIKNLIRMKKCLFKIRRFKIILGLFLLLFLQTKEKVDDE